MVKCLQLDIMWLFDVISFIIKYHLWLLLFFSWLQLLDFMSKIFTFLLCSGMLLEIYIGMECILLKFIFFLFLWRMMEVKSTGFLKFQCLFIKDRHRYNVHEWKNDELEFICGYAEPK